MTGGTGTSSGQFQNVTLFEFADGGDDGDVTFATSHSSVCTGHQARRGCRIQSRRHLATGSPASRANLLLASELTRPQSTAQFTSKVTDWKNWRTRFGLVMPRENVMKSY